MSLAVPQCTWAQEDPDASGASVTQTVRGSNTATLASGGQSGTFSVHYDRHFTDNWAGRVGLGILFSPTIVLPQSTTTGVGVVGVPLGVRWRPGTGNWRLEAGFSVAPGLGGSEDSEDVGPSLWGGPSVGVSRQPADGGLFFRATLTARAVATPDEARVEPGIGLEIGYTF